MAIRIDTKKKLEDTLSKVGIVGEWINPDKNGFSRLYKFNVNGMDVSIDWYCNYSTVMIGNASMFFTHIEIRNIYCIGKQWLEFSYKGNQPLRLKIKE